MRLIKLDTISSTNDFLKELADNQTLENFTVVTAQNQTKGKGQMGAKWQSEAGKNLIMSMYIADSIKFADQIFDINIAFAVSVIKALESFNIPQLSIKWPNDIMSGDKKVGGILIENIFRGSGGVISIAGLGLNVNQINFSELPKASSLAVICKMDFDLDSLLFAIADTVEKNLRNLDQSRESLWLEYHSKMFKVKKPMPFEDTSGNKFMGIIQGIDKSGKLILLLEDDSQKVYGIKEIQMLY